MAKGATARQAAFELFGDMRSSTPEEKEALRELYDKHSARLPGPGIFDLDDMPQGVPVALGLDILAPVDGDGEDG